MIPRIAHIAALTALTLTLALGGCTAKTPATDPAIRGTIQSVSQTDAGIGAVLVAGPLADGTTLDKAMLSITDETRVLSAAEEPLEPDVLEAGMRVEAWITGPVRESYPVQADADVIRLLE